MSTRSRPFRRSHLAGLLLLLLPVASSARGAAGRPAIRLLAPGGGLAGSFGTIQEAVDEALDGDVVVIPAGIYTGPGNRDILVTGKNLTLQGAGMGLSVVDCEGAGRGFHFAGAVVDNATLLADVTVCNGSTAGSGGGILIDGGASPALSRVEVAGCSALSGGGLFVSFSAVTSADGLYVHDNSASMGGGGVAFLLPQGTFSRGRLENNASGSTGGGMSISNPPAFDGQPGIRVEDTTFKGNTAALDGGAFYSEMADSYFVDRCKFVGNSAEGSGGAISVFGDLLITFSDVVFFMNCMIVENTADEAAGLESEFGSVIVQNCTIADNAATSQTGGLSATGDGVFLLNTILWGNSSPDPGLQDQQLLVAVTLPLLFHNDVQGGAPDPTSISADPLFVDPSRNDYRIGIGSPCINAGLPFSFTLTQRDFEGQPRVLSNEIDIGADERVADVRPVAGLQVPTLSY